MRLPRIEAGEFSCIASNTMRCQYHARGRPTAPAAQAVFALRASVEADNSIMIRCVSTGNPVARTRKLLPCIVHLNHTIRASRDLVVPYARSRPDIAQSMPA